MTKIPTGRKVMKGKWCFRVKYNDDRSVSSSSRRAAWVGCGYSQIEGVDYHDTYGSPLPITLVRLFFAAACINNWEITENYTVKALTQAVFDNDEELYIEQPHYMEVADPNVKGFASCCARSKAAGRQQ